MRTTARITDLFAQDRIILSVEFFPPKDEVGGGEILQTAEILRQTLRPEFVSITYGAGGTTRERTWRYALALKNDLGFEVMPHLTCVGSSKDTLREILGAYRDAGIRNIMALRGDPPKGSTEFTPHPDGFPYARGLVELIRSEFPEICIGVAGYPEMHPEAASAEADLQHLKEKVDAGADFITTQLFYDNTAFLEWLDRCRSIGIDTPVIPGLMPIRSATQARRFCKNIPAELEAALNQAENNPAALETLGIEWTVQQICELMDQGLKAFHLYIMNRSPMAVAVAQKLRALKRL